MGLSLVFILLASGMLIGVPIFLSIGFATLAYVLDAGTQILPIFMQRLFASTLSYPFAAVPLFILAGDIMSKSGITDRIITLCKVFVGHWRGGLAQINIGTSVIFAGMSGSALADTAIVGSIMIPAMEREGYEKEYAAAVTAASATLGPIIPPSIVMVIYASTFGVSVAALFAAGLIPGLILGFSQMLVTYWLAVRRNYPSYQRASKKEIIQAVIRAWSALIMPAIILGGIFTGMFTANESAAIAVVYALFLAMVVYRNVTIPQIFEMFCKTALTTAAILFILAVAQNFAWIISREQIPILVMNSLITITENKTLLLLVIGAALFVAGMFVERVINLFLLGPILLPVMITQLEMHPIHSALILIFILGIGHVTPPFGAALYTAAMVGNCRVERVVSFMWPYILGMIAVSLLIMFVEPITLWFPRLVGFL